MDLYEQEIKELKEKEGEEIIEQVISKFFYNL
jgi:hypothetical protein